MTKEGNGGKPEKVSVFPSSAFTDLEDPESREKFKALMKFQYGFSNEQLDQNIEMLRQQERLNVEANFYLLEITDTEHEYFDRIGQVMFAMGSSFIGNKPTYKLDAGEMVKKLQAGEKIEHKLCLVAKIDLEAVFFAEDGGQYRLVNKFELENEQIEVKEEDGRTGLLVSWRKNEGGRLPFGFYTARFGDEIVEKEDFLMMQEPTWEFRKAR